MQQNKKGLIAVFIIIGVFGLSTYMVHKKYMLAISPTDSIPYHLLLVDKKNKKVMRGDIVGFYYSGLPAYGYKKGAGMIKYLACDEGDVLVVKNKKYYCNGTYISTARDYDSNLKKIENFKFDGAIPKGKFFAHAPHKYSFDSRYFGFAEKSKIIGKGEGWF